MTGMAPEAGRLHQGHLFGPNGEFMDGPEPPQDWSLDALGSPLCLINEPQADLAEWVPLIPPALDGLQLPDELRLRLERVPVGLCPGAMPSLFRAVLRRLAAETGSSVFDLPALSKFLQEHAERRGRGNPGLVVTELMKARAAAWLRDLRGASQIDVAQMLAPFPKEGPDLAERSLTRLANRRIESGRRRLMRECVLPWALFPDGSLPDRWWQDSRFAAGIQIWLNEARRANPPTTVGSAARQAMTAYSAWRLTSRMPAQLPPPSLLAGSGSPDEAVRRYWRATSMLNHPTMIYDVYLSGGAFAAALATARLSVGS